MKHYRQNLITLCPIRLCGRMSKFIEEVPRVFLNPEPRPPLTNPVFHSQTRGNHVH